MRKGAALQTVVMGGLLVLATPGCGDDAGTLDGPRDAGQSESGSTRVDGAAPLPTGDQSVFGAIDVAIQVLDYDDYAGDSAGPLAPPIEVHVTSRIKINGGTGAGRVPELRIFGDGIELNEVGSAAAPPAFTFTTHSNQDPAHSMLLEFRYGESSFAFLAEPLDVQFTAPAKGETVEVNDTLIVRWRGIAAAPSEPFGFSDTNCVSPIKLVSAEEDSATFTRDPTTAPSECEAEITATWASEEDSVMNTPFRSFVVTRGSRRIHRFRIMRSST